MNNKVELNVNAIKQILARRNMTMAALSRKMESHNDYVEVSMRRGWMPEARFCRMVKILRVSPDKISIAKPDNTPICGMNCVDDDKIDVDYDELYIALKKAGITCMEASLNIGKSKAYLSLCKSHRVRMPKEIYRKIIDMIDNTNHDGNDSNDGNQNKQEVTFNVDLMYNIMYKAVSDALRKAFEV